MPILVTGSIAYDHILSYAGKFADSFLGESLEHLSLSFLADDHQTFFGGCGPNIAYNLKLLGQDPHIFGVAGNDFERYREWLENNDLSLEQISICDEAPTAVANLLADEAGNQLTIFSPAAMKVNPIELKLKGLDPKSIECATISPEMPERMVYYGRYFAEMAIPYLFDPGQLTHALAPEVLVSLLEGAFGCIVNEYERDILVEKTGLSEAEIVTKVDFLIVTLGEKGARCLTAEEEFVMPVMEGIEAKDVTGGGDAFRAGFLAAYVKDMDLRECCRRGNVAAAYCVENFGTQRHAYSLEEFEERLKSL
jgi:adenosine kinase